MGNFLKDVLNEIDVLEGSKMALCMHAAFPGVPLCREDQEGYNT